MDKIENMAMNVKSKKDFLDFMTALIQDFKNNPESWTNRSIVEYLEAIQSWSEDMEGYYVNNDLPCPQNVSWKVFADILIASKSYE